MATPSSPTARSRELGRRLKELRESRGKTLADIADELSCSQAKVSRMETGQRPVQALDIKVLGRFYQLSDRELQQLVTLAAESRKRGWWQDIDYLDDPGKTFLGLEAAAAEVRILEVLRIPGLLQTPAYTHAWASKMRPEGFWAPEELAQVVSVRQRRQERVLSGALHVSGLVDERAFLAQSPEFTSILVEQIGHLVQQLDRPNVSVHVIPLRAGPHPGLDGSFQILRFPEGDLSDVVFVEGQYGNSVLDGANLVARYGEIYELLSGLALDAGASATWLRERAEVLMTAA